ncbi:MAG: Fic family protein [Caldilineaceae bacterium]
MDLATIIQRVDERKAEINALRPIDREQEQRIMQKFRIDWNYHSNAIEGNTLTYGETRAFLLHGITAHGKPFRDYLDIKGHQAAIDYLEDLIRHQEPLTETYIRELHKILLIEPYEMDALTTEGYATKRRIEIGRYKSAPNSVRTSTGEMRYYALPLETPALMADLLHWYQGAVQTQALHPLILAATFHYRFVDIHPFDDGNGRMARLLTNLILMQQGFIPVVIRTETKGAYLLALEQADAGDLEPFTCYIGEALIHAMELFLQGSQGKALDHGAEIAARAADLQAKVDQAKRTHSDQNNQPAE